MDLKHQLRALINENCTSIAKVSRITGIAAQTLHNWLSGTEPRSLNQVKKVADHFGVTLDYICFAIDPDKQTEIQDFGDEINADIFEVALGRTKK